MSNNIGFTAFGSELFEAGYTTEILDVGGVIYGFSLNEDGLSATYHGGTPKKVRIKKGHDTVYVGRTLSTKQDISLLLALLQTPYGGTLKNNIQFTLPHQWSYTIKNDYDEQSWLGKTFHIHLKSTLTISSDNEIIYCGTKPDSQEVMDWLIYNLVC